MAEICQEIVSITTTGSAGSATGSAVTSALSGFLLDVHLAYHDDAPGTTDVTVALDEPDLGTILTASDTATDALYSPRTQGCDSAGAGITGLYTNFPLNGKLAVSVAGSDALTGAVIARIRYLRP